MWCDTSKEEDNSMKQSQFAEWQELIIKPTQKHIQNVSLEKYWSSSCFYFQIINYHLKGKNRPCVGMSEDFFIALWFGPDGFPQLICVIQC